MATTEHTINDALADLLRGTRRTWRDSDVVNSEDTGQIKGTSERPDILVIEPNVSPVVIETEVLSAVMVEIEAVSRLGAQMRSTGRRILSSIAVRLPVRLRKKHGNALRMDLATAVDLEMALYTGSTPPAAIRWPPFWVDSRRRLRSVDSHSVRIGPTRCDRRSRYQLSERRQ